jgi:hypothetical protein
MRQLASVSFALITLIVLAAPARAEAPFTPIPPMAGEPAQPLALRIKQYAGSTNGELSVQVKNTGKTAQTLDARGLYFVPRVKADEAPQRLGAVGPLQTQKADALTRMETVTVQPGQTVDVILDVFCIDSHRPSPTPETPFSLATDRLPKELTRSINADAEKAADAVGGFAAPASKASVQGEVWKNRDKKWIKLEGEGSQEQGK